MGLGKTHKLYKYVFVSFNAKYTKNMPEEYLEKNKPYVTNDFFEYAMPLTGGIEPKTQIFV